MRYRLLLCVAPAYLVLLAQIVCGDAQQQNIASLREDFKSGNLQRVLATVSSPAELMGDPSPFIPELIAGLDSTDESIAHVAIRVLAKLKSESRAAVPALCEKLSSAPFAIRSSVVEALVAIGEDSVLPVRKLLSSDSATTRSAAMETLGRLGRTEMADVELLINDRDPRVRAALAGGLSGLDKSVSPKLIKLLADQEPAVAVEAARVMKARHRDAVMEIPALIQAVSRPDVGWAATEALGSYGKEAQRAIPAILAAYPQNRTRGSFVRFDDPTTDALKHIGPPHLDDIPAILKSLTSKDMRQRHLVLETLESLQINGKSAVTAIDTAAITALQHAIQLQKQAQEVDRDPFKVDESIDLMRFAERCIDTIWIVSHDSPRFLRQIEEIAIKLKKPIYAGRDSPWSKLPAETIPLIKNMLQHSNRHVRLSALYGLAQMGHRAKPLQLQLLDFIVDQDEEHRQQAVQALRATGVANEEKAMSEKLLNFLDTRALSLLTFASLVKSLELKSPI
ncbi:MAG: hypothetical protein JWM11_4912, partial [Planctomycetaceae bacterium]|nr:hypothetical protein [Planctomycetaceae bacterium]